MPQTAEIKMPQSLSIPAPLARPAPPARTDELTDDELECVVGGLSRPWEGDELALRARDGKAGRA